MALSRRCISCLSLAIFSISRSVLLARAYDGSDFLHPVTLLRSLSPVTKLV
jgi:hypothetical protein